MGMGFQKCSALLEEVPSSRHTSWKSWGGRSRGMGSDSPLCLWSVVAKVGGSYPATMQSPATWGCQAVRQVKGRGTGSGEDGRWWKRSHASVALFPRQNKTLES